ncbi:response regulator [Massilia arenae]|uniref:Response regulator n=1 Tax=Massilia arenae TaxID=2603288 RepID=A0A5C7G787_9BURK|nr:response regulator [Massilia arenae]TXG01904.1 response regulator [Massilia arenae]
MKTESATSKPLKILFVERDPDLCEIFVMIFDVLGHKAKAIASPADALVWAESESPDIIYTSLVFNDLHGLEFATRIRQAPETAKCLLIALTGTECPEFVGKATSSGFDSCLLKPVSIEAFLTTIELHERKLANESKPTVN